jgi:hypothetical protein
LPKPIKVVAYLAVIGFYLLPALTLYLAKSLIHLNDRIFVTALPEGFHSSAKGRASNISGC